MALKRMASNALSKSIPTSMAGEPKAMCAVHVRSGNLSRTAGGILWKSISSISNKSNSGWVLFSLIVWDVNRIGCIAF